MKEPTQEQIKKFWEKLDKEPFIYGEYGKSQYPQIDLNNLFRYAVPKLREYYKKLTESFLPEHYYHTMKVPLMENWIESVDNGEDPSLALFWAIWEVIEGAKGV